MKDTIDFLPRIKKNQARKNRNAKIKEAVKITLVLLGIMIILGLAEKADFKALAGKRNLNSVGNNYEISIKHTRAGIYTQKKLVSIYAGNIYAGFTAGVNNNKLFGSVHTYNNCYGSCDE